MCSRRRLKVPRVRVGRAERATMSLQVLPIRAARLAPLDNSCHITVPDLLHPGDRHGPTVP